MATRKHKASSSTTAKANEAPATPPSRNDMFDAASIKLEGASAILDALAMLNATGNMDTLKNGSLLVCLLHAEKLMDEAGEMFDEAHRVGHAPPAAAL